MKANNRLDKFLKSIILPVAAIGGIVGIISVSDLLRPSQIWVLAILVGLLVGVLIYRIGRLEDYIGKLEKDAQDKNTENSGHVH